MSKLTIFANFFIDTHERYERMQDSFKSIFPISAEKYVVNVRGTFADQTLRFLKNQKIEISCFNIESECGWFYDSKQLIEFISTRYLLFWLEDHLCMSPSSVGRVVEQMDAVDADVLTYTYWHFGKFLNRYSNVEQSHIADISYFDHTSENNSAVQSGKGGQTYLISMPSIIRVDLFKRIIRAGGVEGRWPKSLPFDFEKCPEDIHWLPLRRANPKRELFASIDDDHGEPGSSLQSRQLYPKRERERQSYALQTDSLTKRRLRRISKFLGLCISALLQVAATPRGHRIDFIKSHLIRGYLERRSFPQLNYLAIDYLLSERGRIKTVFEFGSVRSTQFWEKFAEKIVIADHDIDTEGFSDHDSYTNQDKDLRHVAPKLEDPTVVHNPLVAESYHSINFRGYSFREYVCVISEFPNETFDLVNLSGEAHVSSAAAAKEKVKIGGLLVLRDPNDQPLVKVITDMLSGWPRVVLEGSMRGKSELVRVIIFERPSVQSLSSEHPGDLNWIPKK